MLNGVETVLPDGFATGFITISGFASVIFAIFLWRRVAEIRVGGSGSLRSENGREYLLEEEQRGESEVSPVVLRDAVTLLIVFTPRLWILDVISAYKPSHRVWCRRSRRSVRIFKQQSARERRASSSRSTNMSAFSW